MHKKVEEIVTANSGAFGEAGEVTQCMRSLSDFLIGAALSAPKSDPTQLAQKKWAGTMPAGLEHLPAQVDRSMGPDLTGVVGWDRLHIAQELRWLATVLPEAAKGNWAPYNEQGTSWRRESVQALQAIPSLCKILGQQSCNALIEPMVTILVARAQQIFSLATGR
jgi:hypothetical protein